jgi:hypothetical protein
MYDDFRKGLFLTEEEFFAFFSSDAAINFFVGSAISRNVVPLKETVMLAVIRELANVSPIVGKHRTQLLTRMEELIRTGVFHLEQFVQATEGIVGEDKSSLKANLLRIYERGGPDFPHYFIASVYNQGKCKNVITTNFDLLLENAAQTQGIGLKNGSGLLKLHGSVGSKEDISKLMITVRDLEMGLPGDIKENLNAVLRAYPTVFMGYGGNDNDVNEVLRHYDRERKPYIWVTRRPIKDPNLENGMSLETWKTVTRFKDSRFFAADLFELLPKLAAASGTSLPNSITPPPEDVGKYTVNRVKDAFSTITPESAEYLLFKYLRNYGLRPETKYFYERVYRERHKSYRIKVRLTISYLAAVNYRELSDYKTALRLGSKAIKIYENRVRKGLTSHREYYRKLERFAEIIGLSVTDRKTNSINVLYKDRIDFAKARAVRRQARRIFREALAYFIANEYWRDAARVILRDNSLVLRWIRAYAEQGDSSPGRLKPERALSLINVVINRYKTAIKYFRIKPESEPHLPTHLRRKKLYAHILAYNIALKAFGENDPRTKAYALPRIDVFKIMEGFNLWRGPAGVALAAEVFAYYFETLKCYKLALEFAFIGLEAAKDSGEITGILKAEKQYKRIILKSGDLSNPKLPAEVSYWEYLDILAREVYDWYRGTRSVLNN